MKADLLFSPRIISIGNVLIGGIICFFVIGTSWAFGTTDMNVQHFFNRAALVLVPLLLFQIALLKKQIQNNSLALPWKTFSLLVVINLIILAWCKLAISNASGYFYEETQILEIQEYNKNLPHTYSPRRTNHYFNNVLTLTLLFWTVFLWLRSMPFVSGGGSEPTHDSYDGVTKPSLGIPSNYRNLIWCILINGAILGLISIFQRLAGSNKLLFIKEGWAGDASTHFGPFHYRGNGAQYFNLLWPLALGLYWAYHQSYFKMKEYSGRVKTGAFPMLIPMGALLVICPLASLSRGGALTVLVLAPFLLLFLMLSSGLRLRSKGGLVLVGLFAVMFLMGWVISGEHLGKRMGEEASIDERWDLYQQAWSIYQDHFIFGVGPGAYPAVYRSYCEPNVACYYLVHNDYLQTLAEWGTVGAILIWSALLICFAIPFFSGGGSKPLTVAILFSLFTFFIQALFDFPFATGAGSILFAILLAALLANTTLPTLTHGSSRPRQPRLRTRFG